MRIISDTCMRTIIVGITEYDFILEEDVENEYEIICDVKYGADGFIEDETTKVRVRIHKDGALYFYEVSNVKKKIILDKIFPGRVI